MVLGMEVIGTKAFGAVDFLPFMCFTEVDADVSRERGFTHLGCHRGELARIDDEIVRIFREFVGRIRRRWIRVDQVETLSEFDGGTGRLEDAETQPRARLANWTNDTGADIGRQDGSTQADTTKTIVEVGKTVVKPNNDAGGMKKTVRDLEAGVRRLENIIE